MPGFWLDPHRSVLDLCGFSLFCYFIPPNRGVFWVFFCSNLMFLGFIWLKKGVGFYIFYKFKGLDFTFSAQKTPIFYIQKVVKSYKNHCFCVEKC